jgi:hypothetical protein
MQSKIKKQVLHECNNVLLCFVDCDGFIANNVLLYFVVYKVFMDNNAFRKFRRACCEQRGWNQGELAKGKESSEKR